MRETPASIASEDHAATMASIRSIVREAVKRRGLSRLDAAEYTVVDGRPVFTEAGISAVIGSTSRKKARSPSPIEIRGLAALCEMPARELMKLAGYPVDS